jgi:hypothetical protein
MTATSKMVGTAQVRLCPPYGFAIRRGEQPHFPFARKRFMVPPDFAF